MNQDIQKGLVLTVGLVAFAWILFNAGAVNSLTKGTAGAYTSSVTSLVNAGKGNG